jgi:peptide/nickel transport system ATP-binding protein
MSAPVLEVENLAKHFPVLRGLLRREVATVTAVDGISFAIRAGETLCLVGESGCGKSTVGKLVLRLIAPSGGRIVLNGVDVTALGEADLRPHRRHAQMIFQDPYASLNPKITAGTIVGEPIENYEQLERRARDARVARLMERVGLRAEAMQKYPFEFSGGQRQRLGIARALAINPKLIIADEPVSALDVSVQAQVINLMMDLQDAYRLSYIFIAHDLAVVEHISHRVAVMYLGKIVELTDKTSLFTDPLHPYTEALLAAVPIPKPNAAKRQVILAGDVPSPIRPPSGCRFHTRCPYVEDVCRRVEPPMQEVRPGHAVACHLRQPTTI